MTKTFALCLMLAAPAVLAAKDPVQPVAAAFADGEFEKTVKLADKELKSKLPPDTASRLQLLRGQALTVLQQGAKAKEAFRAALQLDATASLNADNTPPDQLELFEDTRKEVVGVVAVSCNDTSAEVWLDGKPFGPVPIKAELPVGKHEIEVRAGTRSDSQSVLVAYKQVKDVKLTLPVEEKPAVASSGTTSSGNGSAATGSSTSSSGGESSPPLLDATHGTDAETGTKVHSGGGKGGSIAMLGVGVVLIGAGGYGSYYALGVKSAYDKQQNPLNATTVTRAEAQRAQIIFPVSVGAAAVGLGLVVGGVIGLASGGSDEGSGGGLGAHVAVMPTADGGQLLVHGRF